MFQYLDEIRCLHQVSLTIQTNIVAGVHISRRGRNGIAQPAFFIYIFYWKDHI